MTTNQQFDVIITGGSYAGLAAAMALGRAFKHVLVIDNEDPCNKQTPHSHNFLTNDGKTPAEIAASARLQVQAYDTVQFFRGLAIRGHQTADGFQIETDMGAAFTAPKLIFATGIKDVLPDIAGASECWGISLIHCPYCHGYEVKNEKTGVLANGDMGFDFARLISNWTRDLTLYTNGTSTFTSAQMAQLQRRHIPIIEKKIAALEHNLGYIEHIRFADGDTTAVKAMYAPSPFEQKCRIPESLGCELSEEGYIKVDAFQQTTIPGVYAIGDAAAKMRTIANAVSTGTWAGISISKKMILEGF